MARIMLVDDDDIIVEVVSDALKSAGHSVNVVYHGDEAIKAVAIHKPDLLILEYTLPGRTGRDILRELRTLPVTDNMPVMMLTSRHGLVHSGIAEIDGADDYVTKPFDPDDLLARVEAMLVGVAISRHVTDAAELDT